MLQACISKTIDSIRRWATLLETWENHSASINNRGEAAREMFSGDPEFWQAFAAEHAPQKLAEQQVSVAETKPTPAQPVPTSGSEPARNVKMPGPPQKKALVLNSGNRLPANGTLAEKLGAAIDNGDIDLDSHTPLSRFRRLMVERGSGRDYWNECRLTVTEVLPTLTERKDWELLVAKMRQKLIFTDQKTVELFIDQCPVNMLVELVTRGEGNFGELVEEIKTTGLDNPHATHPLHFVLLACQAVGDGASVVLNHTLGVILQMRKRNTIKSNHWLYQKAMDCRRRIAAAADRHIDQIQEMAEGTAEAGTNSSAEDFGSPDDGDDPKVDPEFLAAFERQMMEADKPALLESGETCDPDTMSEEELEKTTRPTKVLIDGELVSVQ